MLAQLAGPWWLFLATGVAGLIISAVRSRLFCRLHPIGPCLCGAETGHRDRGPCLASAVPIPYRGRDGAWSEGQAGG